MAKLLANEYSMVSFKAFNESSKEKKNTIKTVVLNTLLLRGLAGSGTTEFLFTLTNHNLYIDNIGYDMTGQLEVYVTEKIDRKDINSFEVSKDGDKEIITLVRSNGKSNTYITDNKNSANLATEMAKFIAENIGD